jgi:flavodoxin I
MKAVIIYDSVFGNTEKIARSIAEGLPASYEFELCKASAATLQQIEGVQLLVVGSPTRSFNATPALVAFLDSLPADSIKGVRSAAFDTRLLMSGIKGLLFKKIIDKGGYAGKLIAARLEQKGAVQVLPDEGFFVSGEEGPLVTGELERAKEWGSKLA